MLKQQTQISSFFEALQSIVTLTFNHLLDK